MKRKGAPSLSLCAVKRVVDALDWDERMQLLEYAHAAHTRWFVERVRQELKKNIPAKYHAQVDEITNIFNETDRYCSLNTIYVSIRNVEILKLTSSLPSLFRDDDEFYTALCTQYDMLVKEYFHCFPYTIV